MSISHRNSKDKAAVATRRISDIIIGKRHRRDMGDLDALARTIRDLGLLHPVVIRPDGTLIAGERRLRAAKLIGWTDVPVNVVDIEKIALGEYAENVERKDFTYAEAVDILRAVRPVAEDIHQVVLAPVGEHSAKPQEVRSRIERLLAGPYLELFARHAIPKWTVWGNEVFEEHTECDRWDCHGDQTPAAEPDDLAIPEFLRRSAP